MKSLRIFALTVAALMSSVALAQEALDSPIHRTALELDARLFEAGFNDCKLDEMAGIIGRDLRFFHDIGGRQNRAEFLAAMKKAICSTPEAKPIRKLVAGSSQVFPLRDKGELYGIIHNGSHEFFIREPGKPMPATNVARFTLVWIKAGDGWQLDTALSFDHRKP